MGFVAVSPRLLSYGCSLSLAGLQLSFTRCLSVADGVTSIFVLWFLLVFCLRNGARLRR